MCSFCVVFWQSYYIFFKYNKFGKVFYSYLRFFSDLKNLVTTLSLVLSSR